MNSKTFPFGENWKHYLDSHFDETHLKQAMASLQTFLNCENLAKRSFLDIGCGTGLFSLAAQQLEASTVVSFDVDPESVACCQRLRKQVGQPENWKVFQASILDEDIFDKISPADIVYSWGVLHHTGNMKKALKQACALVKEEGLFYVAIYNHTKYHLKDHRDGRFGSSAFWKKEKPFYLKASRPLKYFLEILFIGLFALKTLFNGKNPREEARKLGRLRGMNWLIDLRDWLGGWPYECATAEEIRSFFKEEGFILLRENTHKDLRNNEFLFRKAS
jgi:2-polyprenyl-6-hydroxyphenyl methylase/3-demethylubiquinone-9 3-methyltransferase